MLARTLRPLTELTFTLLRVAAGLMFSVHGMQKLFGVFTDRPSPEMFSQLWIGAVIELVTGVLIAGGLFTVEAAFLASGTMAVAYTQFHWKLEMGEQFVPAVNKGEPALLYAFLFLYIAANGAGRWSLDRIVRKKT